MRSFDGTEQTQGDLHTGGDTKRLGMKFTPTQLKKQFKVTGM